MRWQPERADDTWPRLRKCGCGGSARVVHDDAARISCARCGDKVTIEKMERFFVNAASQLEHETWLAAEAWNAAAGP